MKVRMNTLAAGPEGVRRPGTEHDVSVDEAAELVDGGFAAIVDARDQPALDKALAKKAAPEKKQ